MTVPAVDVTVNGRLQGITSVDKGSIDVALCGYGSQVPRLPGFGNISRLTDLSITTDPEGFFQLGLYGNDDIQPAGTYYTITFRNDNGDIAQVNAYIFHSGNTYELGDTVPFDPNISPPSVPVPVGNALQILNPAQPQMDGADFTAGQVTVDRDTFFTIMYAIPGNLYTVIVIQDQNGNHSVTWNGLNNATAVDRRPNATTIQTFVADENGELYAIAPGTVFL